MSFLTKIATKVKGKLKGKKGNPGNPGTSKRKLKKAARATKKAALPQNAMSAEIGGAVATTGRQGWQSTLFNVGTQAATQKKEAMAGLVSNNPKLFDTLKNITGSTNVADFAAYFAKISPSQQKEMVAQSRQDDDIDQPRSTVDKILGYASQATDIYRNASGMEDAAAIQQKKQKNTTLVIVAVVVIAAVVALIFLLKTKKTVV